MRRDPASAPLPSSDYYERVGHLQQGLRDSEKKRLELEKKLYEYKQSDTCRTKLRYIKLKKYLKEICESEKKAHIRNQEYLKRFERVQAHVGCFTANTERLQELKVEFEVQMEKMQPLSEGGRGAEGGVKDARGEKATAQSRASPEMSVSRGLYQPAKVFMGHQMSAVLSTGDSKAEQRCALPAKTCSAPDPHSDQQTAPSSKVTDSCVVQTPSDTQCSAKSDKTDGKTSLQAGEKTPVAAPAPPGEEPAPGLETDSAARCSESPFSEGRVSAELHSLCPQRLSPENRTTDLKCDSCSRSEGSEGEILTREHIEVEEEKGSPPVSALSASEHCAPEERTPERQSAGAGVAGHLAHGDAESQRFFIAGREEQEVQSSCSSSDLTVSVSEDDALIVQSPGPQPKPRERMEGEDGVQALRSVSPRRGPRGLPAEEHRYNLRTPSSPDATREPSGRSPRQSDQAADVGALGARRDRDRGMAGPGGRDPSLKDKATAVLQESLPEERGERLAVQSEEEDESSCSLPSTLNDSRGTKETKPTLRLSGRRVKDQDNSSGCEDDSKEEGAATKVPVTGGLQGLMGEGVRKAHDGGQAGPRASPSFHGCWPADSATGSHGRGWPQGRKETEGKASPRVPGMSLLEYYEAIQPAQSPDKEALSLPGLTCKTKAYQLLKTSTLQENANQIGGRFQKAHASAAHFSGLNIGSSAARTKATHRVSSEASFSSREGSPLSRHENNKKLMTTLMSHAFWGESDDSNSEIEAALRPRNHNTSSDDFDDFYD
ncbi:centrosomal protein kizuna [Ctenodactylus gundi]